MNKLLLEGLSDAIGFIGGALLGFWIGRLFGLNIFSAGYDNASIGAIVLVGLGGGCLVSSIYSDDKAFIEQAAVSIAPWTDADSSSLVTFPCRVKPP